MEKWLFFSVLFDCKSFFKYTVIFNSKKNFFLLYEE